MTNSVVCSPLYVTGVMRAREVRWERHVARMGEIRNAYEIFVRKPEVKRPQVRQV
jgi:hypothetical protein